MLRNPWMKFYPADWRADPALRMCSIAARGLWIEMLCVMHEAEPYGSLLVKGAPISTRQLGQLAGITQDEAEALLGELDAAGVFSREDNGTVYSRRMRSDHAKAQQDKLNGKGGGNPALKRGVNPQDNGGDKAQKLEARESESERKKERGGSPRGDLLPLDLEAMQNRARKFERFWQLYPHKVGKRDAIKAFDLALRAGKVPFEQLMEGLERYVHKTDDRPWCNPGTWLRQGRWEDQPASNNGGGHGRGPTIIDALDRQRARIQQFRQERGSSGVDYQPDLGPNGGLPAK